VRRRRGGDVLPGKLLHGDTIHLDRGYVYALPGTGLVTVQLT
jgi:hypothetical protein